MHNAAMLFAGMDDVRNAVDNPCVKRQMLRGGLDPHAQPVARQSISHSDTLKRRLRVHLRFKLPVIRVTRVSLRIDVIKAEFAHDVDIQAGTIQTTTGHAGLMLEWSAKAGHCNADCAQLVPHWPDWLLVGMRENPPKWIVLPHLSRQSSSRFLQPGESE